MESGHDEVELAARLQHGDTGAFEKFVEVFRSKIFRYSFLSCGHREDAEEVTQETLLKVFEKFDQLHSPEHVRAWVFQIARNTCFQRRRKSQFEPDHEISLDELKPVWKNDGGQKRLEIADWSQLPDELTYRSEIHGMLERSICGLPDTYRSVLLLRDVEQLSVRETALILKVSEESVRTRLHRARLAVRRSMDEQLRTRGEHA